MKIRPATKEDYEAVWLILEPMLRAGEAYALPRDFTREQMMSYWFSATNAVFVLEDEEILGTYYLRANQQGGGSHVANCGYVTAPNAAGRGVARAMCAHSLDEAKRRGFRSMQFNLVVSTNERAVKLWQSMGFAIMATLPGAFLHPTIGYVDAFVMWRDL
jgi:L-amino acid N-acyltransferase YncA